MTDTTVTDARTAWDAAVARAPKLVFPAHGCVYLWVDGFLLSAPQWATPRGAGIDGEFDWEEIVEVDPYAFADIDDYRTIRNALNRLTEMENA